MTTPLQLTRRQAQVLDIVRRGIVRTGRPPSYRAIAAEAGDGFRSKSAVHRVIKALVARGHIARLPGRGGEALTLVEAGAYRIVLDREAEAVLLARAALAGIPAEKLAAGIVADALARPL